jgi:hypothetical protein
MQSYLNLMTKSLDYELSKRLEFHSKLYALLKSQYLLVSLKNER